MLGNSKQPATPSPRPRGCWAEDATVAAARSLLDNRGGPTEDQARLRYRRALREERRLRAVLAVLAGL
ncbi:hypothetical protein DL771_002075 [Monosporascus sp. 5C6A]|nr:hypothetical protein DL771_002075 [Monosporascus sp. 5C6A]